MKKALFLISFFLLACGTDGINGTNGKDGADGAGATIYTGTVFPSPYYDPYHTGQTYKIPTPALTDASIVQAFWRGKYTDTLEWYADSTVSVNPDSGYVRLWFTGGSGFYKIVVTN